MKKLIYILLPLLLVSCEKVLEIDDPANHQMVINALPAEGSRAFVNLAYTRFFLDPSNDHPVDGATVVLYVNGVPYSPDSVSHCNYFFPYTYQADDNLRIDVTAGDRHATAQTYVPRTPVVDGMQLFPVTDQTFRYCGISFVLHDYADYDEYLHLVVTERDSGARYNEWTQEYDTVDTVSTCFFLPFSRDITDPSVCASLPMANYFYSSLLFLDTKIDGQAVPVQLMVLQIADTNEVNTPENPFKHEYTVSIHSITPERWNYLVSASRQSGMSSFFAEQGQVWTNVEGALGIFAGTSGWKYTFDADTVGGAATMMPEIRRR